MPVAFRGALVYKTAQQAISGGGYITWEAEDPGYNCAGIHSTTTNNSRLTVPKGVRRVRLVANLCMANSTAFYRVDIQKNQGSAHGLPSVDVAPSPDVRTRVNLVSAPLVVTPGDYFEVMVTTNCPAIVDSTWPDTWFAMELLS